MASSPGGTISSNVGVEGARVSIHLDNETTGKAFDATLRMDSPDTSSAEWIAEAPSACQGGTSGTCQTVPLADFDSVDFTLPSDGAGLPVARQGTGNQEATTPADGSGYGQEPGGWGGTSPWGDPGGWGGDTGGLTWGSSSGF
jgi:hypothetical protein